MVVSPQTKLTINLEIDAAEETATFFFNRYQLTTILLLTGFTLR